MDGMWTGEVDGLEGAKCAARFKCPNSVCGGVRAFARHIHEQPAGVTADGWIQMMDLRRRKRTGERGENGGAR